MKHLEGMLSNLLSYLHLCHVLQVSRFMSCVFNAGVGFGDTAV